MEFPAIEPTETAIFARYYVKCSLENKATLKHGIHFRRKLTKCGEKPVRWYSQQSALQFLARVPLGKQLIPLKQNTLQHQNSRFL
jgi:hypothetical protein